MTIDQWLSMPCWIVDILPERVPAEGAGQFFAVEKFFLQDSALRRKQLDLILKLNCYYDLTLISENEEARNPEPAVWAGRIGREYLNILAGGQALITADHTDTYMTVYTADDQLLGRIGKLASAEGLFMWKGNG